MPPRFAFGTWWSRYWAYTDEELKDLVTQFQQHTVPLDVLVIDMDWHPTFGVKWWENKKDQAGYTLGWTGYTWNKLYFPDPPRFLSWAFTSNARLDIGYLHLMFPERSTEGKDPDNFNGTYKNSAELLGFTLIFQGNFAGAEQELREALRNKWLWLYALGFAVLAYTIWRSDMAERWRLDAPVWMKKVALIAGSTILLVGLSYLLYEPYRAAYSQGYGALDPWTDSETPIWSYLTHWGVFLFIITGWLAWETRQWMASTPVSSLNKLRPFQILIEAGIAFFLIALLYLGSPAVRLAAVGLLFAGLMLDTVDDAPFELVRDTKADVDHFFAEAQHIYYPWLFPVVRYEFFESKVSPAGLATVNEHDSRIIPAIVTLVRANVETILKADIEKLGDAPWLVQEVGASLAFVF